MFRNRFTSFTRPRKALAVIAIAAAALGGIGGGTAFAASHTASHAAVAQAPPSHSLSGCNPASRMPDNAYTNPGNFPGCPANESPFSLTTGIKSFTVAGDQLTVTMNDGSQATATLPAPQPVTASAQTNISNDYDSSASTQPQGIKGWAVDTLTRQITVTRHGQVAVSNCGGTATNGITTCWYFTALMTDLGSFKTVAGANSPNAGTPINGTLSGSITGGSSYEFFSSSGAPNAALVPASLDASTTSVNSPDWPERFFSAGTSFGGMNEINWSYTYDAPTTCQAWTDAFNNGGGSEAGDGDITGVNACTS